MSASVPPRPAAVPGVSNPKTSLTLDSCVRSARCFNVSSKDKHEALPRVKQALGMYTFDTRAQENENQHKQLNPTALNRHYREYIVEEN